MIHFLNKEITPLGQGTWKMGENPKLKASEVKSLRFGIELGLSLIDTAEMYSEGGAERCVGEAISVFPRESVTIVSKVYPWNAGAKKIIRSCEESLKRLNTDYLDLYLLHWEGSIPFEETLEGFYTLKKQGKIRFYGVSNFDTPVLQDSYRLSNKSLTTNQVLYNITSRGIEFDLLPWMEKQQMPLMAYCPIAQAGRLSSGILKNKELSEIAQKHMVSTATIMLAWLLRKKSIIPIPKAGSIQHIEENAQALHIQLSPEELAIIDKAFPPPDHKLPLDVE